jgi:FHS family L-fucose permease-like MFS transporter
MAIPAGLAVKKYGYKKGIIFGLLLFALGSFLFIPAADTGEYVFFLGALFIIACGLTILETVANPYVSLLGDPETATSRLNFAQSFNGLAATLAPIIGARIILTKGSSDVELNAMTDSARQIALAAEASSVKVPYFVLGSIILLLALIFYFLRLPEIAQSEEQSESKHVFQALRHKHLSWAVIAQFFYVGAQVCVFSFFILYAVEVAQVDRVLAADYLGWGCGLAFMLGRFIGVFFMRFIKSERLLAIYAMLCILLCIPAIFMQGMIAVYCVIGIAFFMSIMFPTIFSLGIKGLGKDTEYGSSLIVMAIVGGAFLPLAFGYISDLSGTLQLGYIVTLICFVVILVFALKGHKIEKKEFSNG